MDWNNENKEVEIGVSLDDWKAIGYIVKVKCPYCGNESTDIISDNFPICEEVKKRCPKCGVLLRVYTEEY